MAVPANSFAAAPTVGQPPQKRASLFVPRNVIQKFKPPLHTPATPSNPAPTWTEPSGDKSGV